MRTAFLVYIFLKLEMEPMSSSTISSFHTSIPIVYILNDSSRDTTIYIAFEIIKELSMTESDQEMFLSTDY